MKKSNIHSNTLYPHPSTLGGQVYNNLCILHGKTTIIVSTSYHKEITGSMAYSFMMNHGTKNEIHGLLMGFIEVPGAFEIPLTTKLIIEKFRPKEVLALGCIIKGDTKHNEYLSSTVINGLRNLSLEYRIPIINGVLTTDTLQQAIDRAGQIYDKGKDFASSSMSMDNILNKLNND